MTFDPTKNRVPYGLLTEEERASLITWPHGWEAYNSEGWKTTVFPEWIGRLAYRGKPAPVTASYWAAIYPNGPSGIWRDDTHRFKGAYSGDALGIIQLDIKDGVPSVRIVEVPR